MNIKKYALALCLFSFNTLASHEISFDLGGVDLSEKQGGDVGLHGQLGYHYNISPNLSLYAGYGAGAASIGNTGANIFVGALGIRELKSKSYDYHTVPLALQFSLPLGNNLLFVRGGANYFRVSRTIEELVLKQKAWTSIGESVHTTDGVGLYGAVGWKYYFGKNKNWNVGLAYQRMEMSNYHANVGTFNFGYRF